MQAIFLGFIWIGLDLFWATERRSGTGSACSAKSGRALASVSGI
jgi:hypothetical protein